MYSDMNKKKQSLFPRGLFHRRTKRLLTDNEREFQKYLNCFLIGFFVFLIIGILIASWSTLPIRITSVLFGVVFFAFSVLHFIYFRRRRHFEFYRLMLFFGIVGVIFALLFFITDIAFMERYLLFLGIYIILMSFERLFEVFYFIRVHYQGFIFLLVAAFLNLFLGILLIVNPFAQLMYYEILGIFTILYCVLNLTEIMFLHGRISEFVSAFD